MIAIPFVDVRNGVCPSDNRDFSVLTSTDPVQVLHELRRFGFGRIHLRDSGEPPSRRRGMKTIARIPLELGLQLQVDPGGVRVEDTDELLAAGATYVVVRPPRLDEHDVADLVAFNSSAIIVAVQVCARRILSSAPNEMYWSRFAADWIEEIAQIGVAAVLVESVDLQGNAACADLAFLEDLVESVSMPVLAAGLLETLGDLDALQDRGVAGALLRESLYSGRIDPWAAAQEFGA